MLKSKNQILQRSANWIFRYRYVVIIAWIVLLLVMLPVAPRAQERLVAGGFTGEGYPSDQARKILQEQFDISGANIILIITHPTLDPYAPEFISHLDDVLAPIREHPNVANTITHLDDPTLISKSGDSIVADIQIDLNLEQSLKVLNEISELLEPGPFTIVMTGAPPLYRDIVLASGEDARRSEIVAFPLATITLIIVFGTIIAAFMPVIVGGVAVATGLGVVFYISGIRDMSILSFNIITLLGIGMGIDYSLFYVNRFREELSSGASIPDALAQAHSKAGIAIIFSGITSMICLAGLLLFGLNALDSVGIGAVIVILVALLSALTLMPALLAVIGDRINRIRIIPKRQSQTSIFWRPVAQLVMQRPLLVLIPAVGTLLILTFPIKDLQLGTVDGRVLPQRFESRRGFDTLQQEFDWNITTELIVLYLFEGDPFDEDNLRDLYTFGKALENIDKVEDVASFVNLRPTLTLEDYKNLYQHPEAIYDAETLRILNETLREGAAIFSVSSSLHPFSRKARNLVGHIRSFNTKPEQRILVDGGAASLKDLIDSLYGRLPYVIALAVILTFLAMMLLFRSVLIPLKAVILNALSISASYGALVWVFQQGNLSSILNFQPLGIIDTTMPIVLFAVIFGLSMDYEIFLLSRVREAHRNGASNRESVISGLQRSGMIITGAGAILIVVGASFVLADVITVKATGFGLALAIFIDVTIVRILIAPALMSLFGPWNWWLPKWLDRALPKIEAE